MQRITLDDFVLSSEPDAPTPADPVVWKLTELGNWYSSAPVKANISDLPLSDGGFSPERTYRSPKTITVSGVCYGGTAQQSVDEVWQVLAAIGGDGTSMLLTVTDESAIVKHMTVWLTSAPLVAPLKNNAARFQFSVTAADPRKYGPEVPSTTQPSGGAADGLTFPLFVGGYLDFGTFSPTGLQYITNTGTAESWPVFKVRGYIDPIGFEIFSSSQVLRYSAEVLSGNEVVLSPYAGGRASLGTVDVTQNLTMADWPSIKPGETRLYVFRPLGASNSAAQMTTTFAPAWW